MGGGHHVITINDVPLIRCELQSSINFALCSLHFDSGAGIERDEMRLIDGMFQRDPQSGHKLSNRGTCRQR